MNNIETKGKEIFEWYYTNLPPVHTNKQRGELAKKFSLHMIKEIIEGYEFDAIHMQEMEEMDSVGDKRIMDKINFWDGVETHIRNKKIY